VEDGHAHVHSLALGSLYTALVEVPPQYSFAFPVHCKLHAESPSWGPARGRCPALHPGMEVSE
jgi:hypothetical protein